MILMGGLWDPIHLQGPRTFGGFFWARNSPKGFGSKGKQGPKT